MKPPSGEPFVSPTSIRLTFGQHVNVTTLVGITSIVFIHNVSSGSEPLTTTFYKDGSVIVNDSNSLTITNPTDDDFGNYTVVVSSVNCGAVNATSRITPKGKLFKCMDF